MNGCAVMRQTCGRAALRWCVWFAAAEAAGDKKCCLVDRSRSRR